MSMRDHAAAEAIVQLPIITMVAFVVADIQVALCPVVFEAGGAARTTP